MRFLLPVLLAVLVVAVLGCAWATPSVWRAWRLYAAGDDPAARAEVRLEESFTAPSVAAEIEAAIKGEDEELATSFIALAAAHGVPVDPQIEARVAALRAKGPERALHDFGQGFVEGERANLPALVGSTTSDLLGYGDLRDLWREGQKLLAGGTADELTVGFAAAGLALSVATWTSIGAALPERAGLSALKIAQKTGRLSRALTASLARLAAKALDREALAASFQAASRADVAAARAAAKGVLRPAALKGLQAAGTRRRRNLRQGRRARPERRAGACPIGGRAAAGGSPRRQGGRRDASGPDASRPLGAYRRLLRGDGGFLEFRPSRPAPRGRGGDAAARLVGRGTAVFAAR